MERKKVLELDKICRVCIAERKDMRPLFSEKVSEMLMEIANVNVKPTEGWPDKICVQCVHAVSRCHAFKNLVERNDLELRDYIKSLTVRVVIDDHELKLQESQAKLLALQQQQQALLQQQQEQERLQQLQQQQLLEKQQQLLEKQQQQKQQKLLQKQLKQQQQQQLLQQQQQQLEEEKQQKLLEKQQQQQLLLQQQQQQKKRAASLRKTQRQTKKQQQQQHQQQQHQQQQHQQQQHQQQQHQQQQHQQQQHQQQQHQQQQHQQQQQQQHQLQQQLQSQILPEPVAMHTAITISAPRSQQQSIQTSQLLPATTAALPPQIVMPNGQVLTTAQIVTHAGPPQIAQIISTNPTPISASVPALSQQHYAPQLIQTTSGQTLQLIQQPNGQHTLQLVQLVPQRTITSGVTVVDEVVTDDVLIDQSEHHILDDDENEDDEEAQDGQICETIVVEEEQLQQQQLLVTPRHHHMSEEDQLAQNETQELEYLEDITVTTTTGHHHAQLLHDNDVNQQQHMVTDDGDDDDIIEEIHMEGEELLEDELHVLEHNNADGSGVGNEFISEDDLSQQQLVDDEDCCEQHELQYTVMETAGDMDDDALVESDVNEVLQAACGADIHAVAAATLDFNGAGNSGASVASQTCISKKLRKASSKAIANSRQLAATASSIATAGADEDFEIDSKFILDFISQQTTSLGSGRYVCNLCRQEFKQFKGLHNHMHSHTNWIRANWKKQPQCEICFKSFKGPGMLKMHMKTHQSAARTPTCNICGKCFKTKAILYRHRQTHQKRSYSCAVDNCRKTFSASNTLRAHCERKHSNTTQPKFKCGECSTLFDDVDVLHAHVEITGHGNSSSGAATVTEATVIVDAMDEDGSEEDVIVVTQA